MSLPKISSKETIENQIEGNGKRIASVEKTQLNLKAETTIVKKKGMEEEVQSLKKRIECLEKKLDEIRRSKETITEELEKRIKALEEEKQALIERNKELDERLKKMEEENKEKDERIKKLEKARAYDQSVLILMQIGTTLQRNMCKYVLGEYFEESSFYKYGEIDNHINNIDSARDQESAKGRQTELDEKCPWDRHLVNSLKTLNGARIAIAHPELSSEKIKQATEHLRRMEKIDDKMVKKIMKLKELWETSEGLLRRRSSPEV